jgi:hypothetical protein
MNRLTKRKIQKQKQIEKRLKEEIGLMVLNYQVVVSKAKTKSEIAGVNNYSRIVKLITNKK